MWMSRYLKRCKFPQSCLFVFVGLTCRRNDALNFLSCTVEKKINRQIPGLQCFQLLAVNVQKSQLVLSMLNKLPP